MGQKIRRLCKRNRYDWVISVSYPFMMHRLVKRYHPRQTHWAMYALDPFYNNATYSARRHNARLRLELRVSKAVEAIFHVPEQAEDYACDKLQPIAKKYHPLDYPNFARPKKADAINPLKAEAVAISLLYVGTLYAEIRTPDLLLTLFEAMHTQNPQLQLHLIGNVYGLGAEKTILRYKNRLGDALQTYLPVPEDTAKAALQAADVLVNIGNRIHNQMPSKLWEYIATGKPILNISLRDDCNTLPYLERYPMCFFSRNGNPDEAAAAVEFILSHKGQSTSWEDVALLYPTHLTQNIGRRFLQTLSDCQKS